MSTADEAEGQKAVIRTEVSRFLQANFPQIRMHGGQAAITAIDLEERRVYLRLGGYCNGCGLSPMTSDAIRNRLPAEIDGIDYVSVETGELNGGRF